MWLYLIFIIIILLIVDQFKPRRFVKLHQQVGIDWTCLPIMGHGYKFLGNNEDRYNAFTRDNSLLYKSPNGIASVWLGFILMLVVSDPIQAVAVLKSALDLSILHKFLHVLMGNGIVFSPASIWHRRRKILAPTFAPRNVSKFVGIFTANARIVANQLESKVGKGNFSSWNYICHYGLDSVCETILGIKMGTLTQPENTFMHAFEEYMTNIVNRICSPLLHNDTLYRLLPVFSRQQKTQKVIHDFIDNVICEKKQMLAHSSENESNDDYQFKPFLDLMITSSKENDKGYTDEELREESLALVLAATDTSSTGLSFTLLLLSQYQDIQDKVYNELVAVLENTEKQITFEDLQKLKYMDAVIKETLRLYPPIPFISRDSAKDFSLPSGLKVPSGCQCLIHIQAIQRNPQYWGADAENFRPDRFLTSAPQTPGAFMAFSYGARNCPGQLYAMLSMKTTLATILLRYRLLPATSFKYDKDNPLRISYEIMIKHVDNFDLQIEYRNSPNIEERSSQTL